MSLSVAIKKKLKGFSLNIAFDLETVPTGILGPSGCGKSMTLRCIAGLDKPDTGRIVLNGRTLFDSDKGIDIPCRERRTGFLFQHYALFPHMTARENIGFGLTGLTSRDRTAKIDPMLEAMGLHELGNRLPHQLSGGQQQRVSLARCLVSEPEILLLDEPFSALDTHLKHQMLETVLKGLSGFKGDTLFVSHDLNEAYRICQNFIILSEGKINAMGPKTKLCSRPNTLLAAQLAGITNFSRYRQVDSCAYEAIDWGTILRISTPVNATRGMVGIRARDIGLSTDQGKANMLSARPGTIIENPYSMTVKLLPDKNGDQATPLEWELDKKDWHRVRSMPLPLPIELPSEKLIWIEV